MFLNKRKSRYLIPIFFMLGLLIISNPAFEIQAASPSAIAICQAGYGANQIKRAVAVVKGTLSNKTYQLIRATDGKKVANGTMVKYNPTGWTRGETYI